MRLLSRLLATIMVIGIAIPARSAHAQRATERGGTHDRCTTSFYDPDMYNWFAFKNSCTYDISVEACGEDRGGCWTMDRIRPGKKDNFGQSRAEIQAMGGVVAYVCRAGWIAVDGRDQPIDGGRHPYKCKDESGHYEQGSQLDVGAQGDRHRDVRTRTHADHR